eukprot:2944630-Rhodomonas_salina.2
MQKSTILVQFVLRPAGRVFAFAAGLTVDSDSVDARAALIWAEREGGREGEGAWVRGRGGERGREGARERHTHTYTHMHTHTHRQHEINAKHPHFSHKQHHTGC